MNYGANNSKKVFCKTHEQFHPANEDCPWCDDFETADTVPAPENKSNGINDDEQVFLEHYLGLGLGF